MYAIINSLKNNKNKIKSSKQTTIKQKKSNNLNSKFVLDGRRRRERII
jgi:hypothetical protein